MQNLSMIWAICKLITQYNLAITLNKTADAYEHAKKATEIVQQNSELARIFNIPAHFSQLGVRS